MAGKIGRPKSPKNVLLQSGLTPGRLRQKISYGIRSGKLPSGSMKGAGVHNFPGKIRDSTISKYPDGTPGLFVQSTKGMKGKHYLSKALERTVAMFTNSE